jgi:hypothetical protein
MSGLATYGALVGGGTVAGLVVLGTGPALASVAIMNHALRHDDDLPGRERAARTAGRIGSAAGAVADSAAGVAAVSALGVPGLGATGISSGLATIGATVTGGGMAAGCPFFKRSAGQAGRRPAGIAAPVRPLPVAVSRLIAEPSAFRHCVAVELLLQDVNLQHAEQLQHAGASPRLDTCARRPANGGNQNETTAHGMRTDTGAARVIAAPAAAAAILGYLIYRLTLWLASRLPTAATDTIYAVPTAD